MKLKLLKDHVLGKADEVVEVTEKLGNYLVRCNVGVEVKAGVAMEFTREVNDKPTPSLNEAMKTVKPKKAKKK